MIIKKNVVLSYQNVYENDESELSISSASVFQFSLIKLHRKTLKVIIQLFFLNREMSFTKIILLFAFIVSVSASINPRIAIIGGGIGGTSCAYFLRKSFLNNASISLFERGALGGRLSLIEVDGEYFEAGGSVIHPRNKYMKSFATLFGIKERSNVDSRWGIYNGNEFIFEDSKWSIVTLAKLLWRYGWDNFRLNRQITSLMNDFHKIYKAQEKGQAFTTVQKLLKHMNPLFLNMTEETIHSSLIKKGFSERFINELAQAVMLVNYGQTTDINAFVGYVSLAGSESGLWSMVNGNNQVSAGLVAITGTRLVKANVTTISLQDDESFLVSYVPTSNPTPVEEVFDVVIIASPLIRNSNNIKFENFMKDMTQYEGLYQRTISTFVVGKLKNIYHSSSVPDDILTNNKSFVFNSIGRTFPVTGTKDSYEKTVYKIFSKVPMTDGQLKDLFEDVSLVKSKDWLAYPHYDVPEMIPPFILHSGLYYLNAIERSASAMEMSAIAGRNIALLCYNVWKQKLHLVDSTDSFRKTEL